jgi:hypothetical protein
MFCLSDWEILLSIMSTYLETYSLWSASLKNVMKSLDRSKEALVSPTPCLKYTNSPWCSCVLCSHAHQGLSNSTNSAAPKFLQRLIFSDENTQNLLNPLQVKTINITKSWWVHPYSSRAWAWAYSAKYSIQKRLGTHLTAWSLCVGLDSMTK